MQKDPGKGLTSVNRNVEDLRMGPMTPHTSDPNGVEPYNLSKGSTSVGVDDRVDASNPHI